MVSARAAGPAHSGRRGTGNVESAMLMGLARTYQGPRSGAVKALALVNS